MKNFITNIHRESDKLRELNSEEFDLVIEKLKKRSQHNSLESLTMEWFAVVQEMSFRTIGFRHFDTQLAGGLLLHQGKIVEMKTGEGKTLTSTLPVALNALSKKGVHVVTVNEYLAERDQQWMGKIYKGLGLSVGLVKSDNMLSEKRKSYHSDITYVTNSELVFDYLRDCSAYTFNELVQRPFHYCLLDEIDSILIDEARTPLILSTPKGDTDLNKLYLARALAKVLQKGIDFEVDEKRRDINLTEVGYEHAKERLGKKSLYDSADAWILEILNALKAQYLFKLNKDYIVLKNKVMIVDEFTGRIMEDRRWSMGIHEAIELKEKVSVGGGTKTKSSITYQNFFTLYPKVAGMTGTAKTTEKEFKEIYNLEVVVLPTAKDMIRKDLPDLIYQTEFSKWKAVLKQAKECFLKGQPILIGTGSVEKSDFLSDLFTVAEIPHEVLNAKPENVARESEIVAQAGEKGAVTIATNMAGRGTDIILGGNPIFKVKQKIKELVLTPLQKNQEIDLELTGFVNLILTEYNTNRDQLESDIFNLPYSLEVANESLKQLYHSLEQEMKFLWQEENQTVKNLGGLFVLGTERHETRRIDNQLRGRSGRQGDPGNSQFFVSLDDDLIKIFGGDSIRRWVDYLIQDEDIPLESSVLTKSLESAQKKVELYNYDIRKNVFQYDEILNTQRKQVFQVRNQLVCENVHASLFLRFAESFFDQELTETEAKGKRKKKGKELVQNIGQEKRKEKEKRGEYFSEIENWFDHYSTYQSSYEIETNKTNTKKKNKSLLYKEIWISNELRYAQSDFYQGGLLINTRAVPLLCILDYYWTEHLERMSYIRETINWRSYGQQNPLTEYNVEAFDSFTLMLNQIRSCMLYYFLSNSLTE